MITAQQENDTIVHCTEMITDSRGIKRRCKVKVKNKNEPCHIHKKVKRDQINFIRENVESNESLEIKPSPSMIESTHNIMKPTITIEHLDRLFKHNLMNLYGSWSEINSSEYIELDNEIWPISIIISTITHQLNNSNMENPYLIYPNNPFTRTPFTPKSLIILSQKIKELNIPVNIVLKLLLEQPEKSIVKFYNESLHYLDRHSILLMSVICKHLRFMTINCKNSQSNYIGFWVRMNKKKTPFEILHTSYNEAPYQIINRGMIVNNPYREYLKLTLKNLPLDESQPTDDEYCEYLT